MWFKHIYLVHFTLLIIVDIIYGNDNFVGLIRERFLNEAAKYPGLYEPKDVQVIRTNDDYIKRFLGDNGGEADPALKQLIRCQRWRKDYGIRQLNVTSFPQELYKSGLLIPYGKARNGEQILIFRRRTHSRFHPKWTQLVRKYIAYRFETISQIDYKNGNKGVYLIADYNGFGINNVDIPELLIFFVAEIRECFPGLLKAYIAVNIHFSLARFISMILSWLPPNYVGKVKVMRSSSELDQYVTSDQLPDFLLGTNKTPYRVAPEGALTVEQMRDTIGIPKKEQDDILQFLKPYYNGTGSSSNDRA